jgi:hypothetical protein
MPPPCRLNAKQTEDEMTRLRLESEACVLAHKDIPMSAVVIK